MSNVLESRSLSTRNCWFWAGSFVKEVMAEEINNTYAERLTNIEFLYAEKRPV